MPAASKVAAVEEMTAVFQGARAIYLADFTGLDVPRMTELRKRLHAKDVRLRVAKNRLAKIALKNAGLDGLGDALTGPTGFVVVHGDVVAPAKVLSDFAREADGKPKLKLGLVEGEVYVAEQIAALASLPSREVLLAQVVGAIQSPITGLVFTLQAILRSLVGTLSALADKRKAQEGAPQADAPQADASQAGASQAGAPQAGAPQAGAPQAGAPQADAPQAGAAPGAPAPSTGAA